MKSDGNVYVHAASFATALANVYDLMAVGKPDKVKNVFQELHTCFLLKETGTLNNGRDTVRVLGRHLERSGGTAFIFENMEYYLNLLKEFQMENCREAPAPAAPPTSSTPQVVEEVVDKEKHGLSRRAVGRLQW